MSINAPGYIQCYFHLRMINFISYLTELIARFCLDLFHVTPSRSNRYNTTYGSAHTLHLKENFKRPVQGEKEGANTIGFEDRWTLCLRTVHRPSTCWHHQTKKMKTHLMISSPSLSAMSMVQTTRGSPVLCCNVALASVAFRGMCC